MKRVQHKLEFIFRASPTILHQFLTTPSCLVRWFCDEVDIEKGTFNYSWDGEVETAKLVEEIEGEYLKFQWEDAEDDEYLEFIITKSPVTGDTLLNLIEFCDEDEIDDQTLYWEDQMKQLRSATGG